MLRIDPGNNSVRRTEREIIYKGPGMYKIALKKNPLSLFIDRMYRQEYMSTR